MQISKKERKYYLITILILTFVFAYNDRQPFFEWTNWLKNLFLVLIAVSISFLIKQYVTRKIAIRNGFDYEYDFWKIGRLGFSPESALKYKRKQIYIPIGIILPIILTIISGGIFYFPVVGSSDVIANRIKRTGKIFVRGSGLEIAKVYLSGPLTYLFLTLLFFNLQKLTGLNLEVFVLVNLYLSFYSLLPLPGLEGCEVLFNSLLLYVFAIAFFTANYILLKTNVIFTLIFSVLIAFLILVIYTYKYEQ